MMFRSRPPPTLPYENGVLPVPTAVPSCGLALRPGGLALTVHAIRSGAWYQGDRVLDLGCGQGEGIGAFRDLGIAAFGLDVRPAALADTRRTRPHSRLVAGRGEALPFLTASLDGVLAECSLSVMVAPPEAVAEIFRVLKPGGRLVITDMFARAPRSAVSGEAPLPRCLARMLRPDDLFDMLNRAGFVLMRSEDHSDALKSLVGRVILEQGSLSLLWGGGSADDDAVGDAVRRLRPGYLLVVAMKPERNQGRTLVPDGPSSGSNDGV